MIRLVLFLLAILALASGLAWLADKPGSLLINWEGYQIETSVFRAVVLFAILIGVAMLVWSILRQIWMSPATVGHYLTRRRQRRGLDALSSGMIAIGAGDRSTATRYAIQARRSLPNEPLTHLLRAQAAQLSGDKATSRRIFEAMLGAPDTEQLGLRGLFLEAHREGEKEAAMQFAERAIRINPRLGWPIEALFDLQCKEGNWAGALETLAAARRYGHVDKVQADRRRAVLLTAQAQAIEETEPDKALTFSLEAHGLAPDLIPAAAIAGRLLASKGNTARAAKVLQKTWAKAPHPDLATVYAYARIGDSPRDRLDRAKQLAALNPYSVESSIAVAAAAIEAKDFDEARHAIAPLLAEGRMSRRVATLMARIEGEQYGDKGRVREWLARAVNAPRDPAWTADGTVSDRWVPVSPSTGALDAFVWRVPVEELQPSDKDVLAERLEELVALGSSAAVPHTDPSAPESAVVESLVPVSPARATVEAVDIQEVTHTARVADDQSPATTTTSQTRERRTATRRPAREPRPQRAAEPIDAFEENAPVIVEINEPVTPTPGLKGGANYGNGSSATRRSPTEREDLLNRRAPDDPGLEEQPEPDPRSARQKTTGH